MKGMYFRCNGVIYKVTKCDDEHVWGSVIVNYKHRTCRRGRPSKFMRNDVLLSNNL